MTGMELWTSENMRFMLLVLVGVAVLLQFDTVVEDIRRAMKKGGDDNSEEKPSPPKDDSD